MNERKHLPFAEDNAERFLLYKWEVDGKTDYLYQHKGCSNPNNSVHALARTIRSLAADLFKFNRVRQIVIEFLDSAYVVHNDGGEPMFFQPLSDSEQEEFWRNYDRRPALRKP